MNNLKGEVNIEKKENADSLDGNLRFAYLFRFVNRKVSKSIVRFQIGSLQHLGHFIVDTLGKLLHLLLRKVGLSQEQLVNSLLCMTSMLLVLS